MQGINLRRVSVRQINCNWKNCKVMYNEKLPIIQVKSSIVHEEIFSEGVRPAEYLEVSSLTLFCGIR
jgi:hypothetical protein